MRKFWKKQLPAVLLALVMAVGMMPTALAADCPDGTHQWGSWYESATDSSKHERQCLVSGCQGKETAAHNWSSAYSTDRDSHWKSCTVCGVQQPRESHDFLSGIKLSRPGYRFHIGFHNTLHRKSGRCRIVAGSLFVPVVRPVHPDGQRLFSLQSAAGKREGHMIHAVCHKIHRSRIDFLVADPDRYRDAAVSVISIPVVQTEPYRNAFKLFCRIRRDSQIKDGKVVVTLSPDRIKRGVPFLGINAACRPGRCGCLRVGTPTEKIVSVPCRYSGRR